MNEWKDSPKQTQAPSKLESAWQFQMAILFFQQQEIILNSMQGKAGKKSKVVPLKPK